MTTGSSSFPNADLYTATITNNTASPYRRQEFVVGVGYGADSSSAFQPGAASGSRNPGVMENPPPSVVVDTLAPGSVNLRLLFHTDLQRRNAVTAASEVKQQLIEASADAGISDLPGRRPGDPAAGAGAAAVERNQRPGSRLQEQ